MEDSVRERNLKHANYARKDCVKVNIWRNIFVRFMGRDFKTVGYVSPGMSQYR
jgi:hypothetical protein